MNFASVSVTDGRVCWLWWLQIVCRCFAVLYHVLRGASHGKGRSPLFLPKELLQLGFGGF